MTSVERRGQGFKRAGLGALPTFSSKLFLREQQAEEVGRVPVEEGPQWLFVTKIGDSDG